RRRPNLGRRRSSTCCFYGLQNFFNVAGDSDFGKYGGNFAGGVDDEGGAFDAHVCTAEHGFFFPDAVGFGEGVAFISQEGEGELVFAAKFGVTLEGVGGDAQNDCAGLAIIRLGVAKGTGLFGAGFGVVGGVKVENDLLAFEVLQGNSTIFGGRECEGGGRLADRGHEDSYWLMLMSTGRAGVLGGGRRRWRVMWSESSD